MTFWIAWYIGTVPIGTGLAAMMAWRIASILPPVERSITVSEPRSTASLSLASSLSMSEVTAELPMLALILHFALMPIPIGWRPSFKMHRVGRDDHPAAGDLGADQLGVEVLAAGDELHLGGDRPLAGLFDLRHCRASSQSRSHVFAPGLRSFQCLGSSSPYRRRVTATRSIVNEVRPPSAGMRLARLSRGI